MKHINAENSSMYRVTISDRCGKNLNGNIVAYMYTLVRCFYKNSLIFILYVYLFLIHGRNWFSITMHLTNRSKFWSDSNSKANSLENMFV